MGRHGRTQHDVGRQGPPGALERQGRTNIKWKAQIGSTSNGNPVVADGKVFLGTNNGNPKQPVITGDKGVLMCFREPDGQFLWQAVTDKLGPGADTCYFCPGGAAPGDGVSSASRSPSAYCMPARMWASMGVCL